MQTEQERNLAKIRIGEYEANAEDFATRHAQILAMTRKGKTYAAGIIEEKLLDAGIPIVVIDAVGQHWGIKQEYDVLAVGSKQGKERDHIDIAFEYTSGKEFERIGEELAQYIATNSNVSIIIDMKGWKFYGMRKFVTTFLDELFAKNEHPRHIFIEEADIFAPQTPVTDEQQFCEAAVENIARRGSAMGLGSTIITQRPASVAKNILSQSDISIILNLGGAQDLKAFADLVKDDEGFLTEKEQEEPEAKIKQLLAKKMRQMKSRVKNLPTGEAFVYSPQWLDVRDFTKIGQRKTYHSGATLGNKDRVPQSKIELLPYKYVEHVKNFVNFDQPEIEEQKKGSSNTIVAKVPDKDYQAAIKDLLKARQQIEDMSTTFDKERLVLHHELNKYRRTTELVEELMSLHAPQTAATVAAGLHIDAVNPLATVVVEEKLLPAEFEMDSVEYRLSILIAKGFFDEPKTTIKVHEELYRVYGNMSDRQKPGGKYAATYRSRNVEPALHALAVMPYRFLDQREGWVINEEARPRIRMKTVNVQAGSV